jgi:hypothetical protein
MWLTIPELEDRIQTYPGEFTGGFLELWPQLRDKIIPS